MAALTFIDQPGHITEVMSGEFACPLEASVPHQLFSVSGFVSGLVEGVMGVEPDLLTNRLVIKPELALLWPEAELSVPLRDRHLNLRWRFHNGELALDVHGIADLKVLLQPRLGLLRPEIRECRLNGADVPFRLVRTPGDWHVLAVVQDTDRASLSIRLDRYLDLLPDTQPLEPGQENRGLKCLWSEGSGSEVKMLAEGRPGADYGLRVTSSHPLRVGGKTVSAGESTLPVGLSGPDPTRFAKKTVTLRQQ